MGILGKLRRQFDDAYSGQARLREGLTLEALEGRVLLSVVDDLRITEVMYNPAEPPDSSSFKSNDFEFVELKNMGLQTLDLTDVSFIESLVDPLDPTSAEGIIFDFAGSNVTALSPGGFVLVVENLAGFEERYGTALADNIAGQYIGKLANNGERIKLVQAAGAPEQTTIVQFDYNDARGWPQAATGGGHALVPVDSAMESGDGLSYSGNWRAGTFMHGSPGQDDPQLITSIVLNEIMPHTDFVDPNPAIDSNDWIEIYNTTGAPISLSGWYLSDRVDDLTKWAIPGHLEIPAHGHVSFDEISDFNNPRDSGFGLNKAGEREFLSYLPGGAQDRIADSVRYKGQENEVSLARPEDGGAFWVRQLPSRGVANTGQILDVVIDEIMYNPAGAAETLEFVELFNPTDQAVALESAVGPWRFDGALNYTFPAQTTIPAGDRLIVVGFNPAVDVLLLSEFETTYSTGTLLAGIDIVGPWSGNLSNEGERLALEKSEEPDFPGDPLVRVMVDEVIYFDESPWPEDADGDGSSLQRIAAGRAGNDPSNWQAAVPTPFPINNLPVINALTDDRDPISQNLSLMLRAMGVSDSDGSIVKVDFYLDTNKSGELEIAADTWLGSGIAAGANWTRTVAADVLPLGAHRYFALAQDDDGGLSNIADTVGSVIEVNAPPTVGLLLVASDPVTRGESLTLTAENVNDSSGTVSNVEFYLDVNANGELEAEIDKLLAADNDGADGWTATETTASFPLGTNHFLARAQDNVGLWSETVTASAVVVLSQTAPTIGALTAAPDPVSQGDVLMLTALNVDNDGLHVTVEFYHDVDSNGLLDVAVDALLGIDDNGGDGWFMEASASFPVGSNAFLAWAQDDEGLWSEIATASVQVEAANVSPSIGALTAAPDQVTQGDDLTLTAFDVNDIDGAVAVVEFYRDGNANGHLDIGVDIVVGSNDDGADGWSAVVNTSTFTEGQHTLFARARDDDKGWSPIVMTSVTVALGNVPPEIDALTDGPDPVLQGKTLQLTALDVADEDGTVAMVRFYLDSDGDSVLDVAADTLLGTDATAADGWSLTVAAASLPIGANTYFAQAQDDDGELSNVVATGGTVQVFTVTAGLSTSGTVIFTDADDSTVTVKLGKGTADLFFEGDGLTTIVKGKTTRVLGIAELVRVQLLETSDKSSLSLSAKGGDGRVVLGDMSGPSLGKFSGKQLELGGDIDLTGGVGSVTIDRIAEGVAIMTGAGFAKGLSLKANHIAEGVVFDLAGAVKRFQSNHFSAGALLADSFGKVSIKIGVLGADVTARTGDITAVDAAAGISGKLIAAGSIQKVSSKQGDFTGVARAALDIGAVQAQSLSGALLSAGRNINKVSLKMDIIDSHILAGYDIGPDGALGPQEPGGTDIPGSGDVGSVSAKGQFAGSYVGAGVLPQSPLTSSVFLDVGLPFVGVFGSIGKVKLASVDFHAEMDFGFFAATEIKPFKIGKTPAASQGSFQVEVLA